MKTKHSLTLILSLMLMKKDAQIFSVCFFFFIKELITLDCHLGLIQEVSPFTFLVMVSLLKYHAQKERS